MYIYADIIFIINMIMNSTILVLTASVAGVNYKLWRILLAGILGSFYVLAGILPGMMIIYQPLGKVLISFILVIISFGFKTLRSTLLLVAFFYVIAFVLGGATAGWLYFWQTSSYWGNNNLVITNISWSQLVLGSFIGILLISIVLRQVLPRLIRKQNLYQIKIEYAGRKVELMGLLDTGNRLYTVIGHRPVIVVNQYALEPILGEKVMAFLQSFSPEMWLTNLDKCMDIAWLARIQITPYHGIGSKDMMLSFRVDHFMVENKSGFVEIDDVVIGIYSGTLATDGEYAALLHSQVINELSKKEGAGICA